MKLSNLKIACLFFLFPLVFSCGSKSSKQTQGVGKVITYTTIDLAANINFNDYPRLTAMKTVYDTVMSVIVDSSGGKEIREKRQVRDSSYMVWYPDVVMDSTKTKPLRTKAGTADSLVYRFIPVDSRLVLHDFNKNWTIR